MTDPRAYLADVLAKADAVDEFQGAWEWRESTPGLGNIYHSQNGLPGEYNLPGCGRCGASDQVFESFVGEFIASARTTSPAMARALIAVLDLHQPDSDGECVECYRVRARGGTDGGDVSHPCPTVTAITDALGAIENGASKIATSDLRRIIIPNARLTTTETKETQS